MAKKPIPMIQIPADTAVSQAIEALQALGEEIQEQVDNMPDNMRDGEKASMLSEAADALSGIETVEWPDNTEVPVVLVALAPEPKRPGSRANRLSFWVNQISVCLEVVQEKLNDEDPDLEEWVSDLQDWVDAVEQVQSAAEAVDL